MSNYTLEKFRKPESEYVLPFFLQRDTRWFNFLAIVHFGMSPFNYRFRTGREWVDQTIEVSPVFQENRIIRSVIILNK